MNIHHILFMLLFFICGENLVLAMETKDDVSKGLIKKKTQEAFLEKDLGLLGNSVKDTRTIDGEKLNVEVYTMSEDVFSQKFISQPLDPLNIEFHVNNGSFFAGQLTYRKTQFGFGTGTIIDVKELNDGSIEAVGITALHNFVSKHKHKHYDIITKDCVSFYQGNLLLEKEAIQLSEVFIDKVFIKPQKNLDDVCLFKGILKFSDVFKTLSGKGNFSSKDFIDLFNKNKPEFSDITLGNTDKKEAYIYHYPQGLNDQKKSIGEIIENNKHSIPTFEGSSGSAILSDVDRKSFIFGIHDGFYISDETPNTVIDFKIGKEEFKNCSVAKANSYFKVDKKYYMDLLNGHDIMINGNQEIHNYLFDFAKNL